MEGEFHFEDHGFTLKLILNFILKLNFILNLEVEFHFELRGRISF